MARKWNNSLFFSETRGDTVKASIPLSGNWLRNKSHLTNRKTRDLFFFRVTNAPRSMRQPREIIAPFVSFTVVFFNEYKIIKSQKCEFSRIGANKDDTLKYTNIFDPSKHQQFHASDIPIRYEKTSSFKLFFCYKLRSNIISPRNGQRNFTAEGEGGRSARLRAIITERYSERVVGEGARRARKEENSPRGRLPIYPFLVRLVSLLRLSSLPDCLPSPGRRIVYLPGRTNSAR